MARESESGTPILHLCNFLDKVARPERDPAKIFSRTQSAQRFGQFRARPCPVFKRNEGFDFSAIRLRLKVWNHFKISQHHFPNVTWFIYLCIFSS